ncbi:alpha/beta hydrolase [Aromatoleum anaerobium]|nr:alpha/beta hydrolase [Aromatoleum anaerobium]MCK0505542.1 alpha/beta hydrolase [Aromatoleum anaerobium]
MPLSSQAKALLDMVYRVGAPRFHELSVDQARHSFRKLQWAFGLPSPAVAATVEVAMRRADGSTLNARLYRPLDSPGDDELPLLIYFHGGGWCVGDLESYDVLCRELANGSGCAVLSIDYRLAPENPFPAAVEDAIFSIEWAAEQAQLLGIDRGRIALGGDSAGGNLSIVGALLARERASVAIRFMFLVYPSTEIASDRPSRQLFGQGYLLDRESLEWFYDHYLPAGDDEDWRASPMRAPSLAGLPPILLVTAECDPLADDCMAFAERVRAEGGEIEHVAVDGVVHGFITLGQFFPEAAHAVDRITTDLRRAVEP